MADKDYFLTPFTLAQIKYCPCNSCPVSSDCKSECKAFELYVNAQTTPRMRTMLERFLDSPVPRMA